MSLPLINLKGHGIVKEFKLPNLGEGIETGDVVQVHVSEGDTIQAEQTVLELETDKAVLEVPCPYAGTIVKIHVKIGDKVPVGATIITVDDKGDEETSGAPATTREPEKPAQAPPEPEAPSQAPAAASPPPSPPTETSTSAATPPSSPAETAAPEQGAIPAGPATRKLARELSVDLAAVAQSNPGARLTPEHVKAFVRQSQSAGTAPPATGGIAVPPLPDFAHWGPIERVPFSSLQRKTADHLSTGWSLAPHVTQFDEADITALEALRKRYRQPDQQPKAKLTVTAFLLKAVVSSLKAYPQFNASLDMHSGELILKRYYRIGVAVDTEDGLIVPVIANVECRGVLALAAELNEVSERTRQRKISLEELRGGTFTITNLGGIGGTAFTPIINYPEVAILGIARSRNEPVLKDDQLTTRTMLPLCLSYDHRVINGADGARFIRHLVTLLEDPEMLLLDG